MDEAYGPLVDEVRTTMLLGGTVQWAMVDYTPDGMYIGNVPMLARTFAATWTSPEQFQKDYEERLASWQVLVDDCVEGLKAETLDRLANEKVVRDTADRERGYFHATDVPTFAVNRHQLEQSWLTHRLTVESYKPQPAEYRNGIVVSVFEQGLHVRESISGRLWHLPVAACCLHSTYLRGESP